MRALFIRKQPNNIYNQQGIALVLVVLVLANLFIITLIVADIVLRIGRGSHQIGQTEISYLAAETAIEQAIYTIESSRDVSDLGTIGNQTSGNLSYANGSWSLYADTVLTMPITCVDGNQRFSFPDDPGDLSEQSCIYPDDLNPNSEITDSNPLAIRLKDGQSFRLDLDIEGINYPSFVTVRWQPSNFEGEVVILQPNTQTVRETDDPGSEVQVPASGSLNSIPHRIKLVNNRGSDVLYTITPSLDGSLPLGILVHSEGSYEDQQIRIIEVERRSWQIY